MAEAISPPGALPPAFWDPGTPPWFDAQQQTWHVFSHADVQHVAGESPEFSRHRGDPAAHPTYRGMWNFNGARHRDLRATVADPFRRPRLEVLSGQIRDLCEALLDEATADGAGGFELMQTFGYRLPTRVICLIMGVEPDSDERRLQHWLVESGQAASTGVLPPQRDLVAYYAEMLERARRERLGGLTDELVEAQRRGHTIDGEPLSDDDLIGYLATFLAAGSHTTATGIGNAVLYLSEFGLLDALRADRALIPAAIEETLRWCPPFPGLRVQARVDVELSGQRVPEGDWVTGWISAANRDPEVFGDPHRFDVRRTPNPHLSFGYGPYHCLGAPLARLELRIALEALLDRFATVRFDATKPMERLPGMVLALNELHVATAPA